MSDSEPNKTPQDKVNKLIDDLFPTTLSAPTPDNLPKLTLHQTDNVPSPAHVARQEMFLQAMEAGWSETKARSITHVSKAVLDWWKQDKSFMKGLSDAVSGGTDYLKDLAFLRAHHSDAVLLRLLEAREPETFKPKAGGGNGNVNVIINNLYPSDEPLDNPQIIINHEEDHDRRNES